MIRRWRNLPWWADIVIVATILLVLALIFAN